ncbi:hypothetical protein PP178_04220 [Zeaxanthinibacter sp. PT1]|uniref:hypothetical protein n=1 Tax=Zeaxanthinibacter TaxID=561554 RepID=UPI00234B2C0A|nr:hypothetical protein [Zeaxanthinibacter sp. PT1]MDC6350745.1 hypothetical protein [Zeaxanthinibacter sp. PT1]
MRTILLLIVATLLLSCSKEEVYGDVQIQLAYNIWDENLDETTRAACANKVPEIMIMELKNEEGNQFVTTYAEQISGGVRSGIITLPEGRYMVVRLQVIDTQGNIAFEVKNPGYSDFQVGFTPFYFGVAPGKLSKLGMDCFCKFQK